MKKYFSIILILSCFALIAISNKNFISANSLEKNNITILKAEAIKKIGQICYSGCQDATPSDVCAMCDEPTCPNLHFGSSDYGVRATCD